MPDAELEPHFAFVLDNGTRAIGYVIATPDSVAFSRRVVSDWLPKVRARVAGFTANALQDAHALSEIARTEPANV